MPLVLAFGVGLAWLSPMLFEKIVVWFEYWQLNDSCCGEGQASASDVLGGVEDARGSWLEARIILE